MRLNLFKGKKGGRRPGSGRKRIHSKGVAHREREKIKPTTPLHINFKYKTYIKNKICLRLLKKAILNSRKHGLRIIHFSLQSNHVHLIVEAETNQILTKGMRSLTVTFAKGLDRGRVQLDRFHLHVLKSLRETKNAVHYVLFNSQKHGSSRIDEYGSILSMPNALEIIRNFAKAQKITLSVKRGELWKPDPGKSYLIRSAEETLRSSSASSA